MKIELREPYNAIESLESDVELPDFAVLIGRNGTGKTQLLQAIRQGHAAVSGIAVEEVELFDMLTFRPPNTDRADRQGNYFARTTADDYLLAGSRDRSPVEAAEAVFDGAAGAIEDASGAGAREAFVRALRDEVGRIPDFEVLPSASTSGAPDLTSEYLRELHDAVLQPLNSTRSDRQGGTAPGYDGNRAALLSMAMRLAGKLPHELTREDILSAGHLEGDLITNPLNTIFAEYVLDRYTWAHETVETKQIPYQDLIDAYTREHRPPWEALRDILAAMKEASGEDGLFDFAFSDPGDAALNMETYRRFGFEFVSEMENRTTGARYELNALSSGERVLMALCLVSFNQYMGRRRPRLLLLDELDTVLHPSMVRALVGIVRELFVSKGTKVLMTSHSPMTVAAVEEDAIFRISRSGGHVEVARTTRSEAIGELSDGIATVDAGLRIAAYDGARVTILTEGNNTKHLRRWVDLYFPKGVNVFEGLEPHTNDRMLLTYGRLLGRMKLNTHFVVVWDCDAASKEKELRGQLPRGAKVTPFSFPKREERGIPDHGIENNYDEEILKPFSNTVMDPEGNVVRREVPNDRKTEFANHVLREGTHRYFVNFRELHAIVSGILEAPD
ncbi:MAG: AAA family ATPase [Chloroflexi bacterium]|nr:AAA family ATPase [Chloroflexota bacterium]